MLVMQDQSHDPVDDYTADYLSSETTVFTQVSAENRIHSRAQGIFAVNISYSRPR